MQFDVLYGTALDTELGSADTSQLFTTVRRKAAINAGQREFARLTRCFTREVSLALVDEQGEYDLNALVTAADFIALADQGVEVALTDSGGTVTTIAGDGLPRITVAALNRDAPGWREVDPSVPGSWYTRHDGGKHYLGLWPAPDLTPYASGALRVPYVALPADLVNAADVPFSVAAAVQLDLIPYHQALVHYGAYVLEKLRSNVDGQRLQQQLFGAYVDQWKAAQRPVGGQRVRFARDYRGERRTGSGA